jgi:hypothetical protein
MNCENPKWCAKCYLRIAPYDSRTVHKRAEYHQNCFLKLVHEQAEERVQRGFLRRAKTVSYDPARTRWVELKAVQKVFRTPTKHKG